MQKAGRPSVAVFGLGGTIAMLQTPEGGVAPAMSASDLVAAVPGLNDVGVILKVRDIANQPGASVSYADVFAVADAIRDALAGDCVGAVVTQGTDTIEETAYLLDLLLASDAPVVVTGAMRNPTMAGSDGPANILAAVRVAASDSARGLGCVVTMNDQVHAARWVQKTNTSSTAAFASPGYGPIGHVIEGHVDIPIRLRHRTPSIRFAPRRGVRIGLVTMALGDDGALIGPVSRHVDGLVVAGFGAGHVPAEAVVPLAELAQRMPVVLASRTGASSIYQETYGFPGSERELLARGLISAGYLPPLKARLLLYLLISAATDRAQIIDAFSSAGGIQDRRPSGE